MSSKSCVCTLPFIFVCWSFHVLIFWLLPVFVLLLCIALCLALLVVFILILTFWFWPSVSCSCRQLSCPLCMYCDICDYLDSDLCLFDNDFCLAPLNFFLHFPFPPRNRCVCTTHMQYVYAHAKANMYTQWVKLVPYKCLLLYTHTYTLLIHSPLMHHNLMFKQYITKSSHWSVTFLASIRYSNDYLCYLHYIGIQ